MKRLLPILLCSLLLSGLRNATAQEASKTWTLQECLDYAYQNNIQVRQSRNNQLSGIEDTKQAKAALFPSLVASTTQSYTNYPSSEVTDNNSYTGTYGITAGMTIFEGGKLRTEVKRQKVQNQMDALSVEESVNDIRIAIVQAYMQCLYAADAVRINRSTAEASNKSEFQQGNRIGTPVALLELGFMTNPTDDANMQDDTYQQLMVRGIADGIDAYFGR